MIILPIGSSDLRSHAPKKVATVVSLHNRNCGTTAFNHGNINYPPRACASKGLCDRSWCLLYIYPARACASKGLCDRSWCLLYIYYILLYICKDFFYLSKYSLSDAHFSTGRLLFEFNRLQYTLAAPEVFVSSANPVILPSGYRVSIVRNTNIDQIETTPLRYCMLHG